MYILPKIPVFRLLDTISTKKLMLIDAAVMSVAYILA
jgi:hypothetical protein